MEDFKKNPPKPAKRKLLHQFMDADAKKTKSKNVENSTESTKIVNSKKRNPSKKGRLVKNSFAKKNTIGTDQPDRSKSNQNTNGNDQANRSRLSQKDKGDNNNNAVPFNVNRDKGDNNNNAVPFNVNRTNRTANLAEMIKRSFKPIIQTRSMKLVNLHEKANETKGIHKANTDKQKRSKKLVPISQDELEKLSEIDTLSTTEILGGEEFPENNKQEQQ